MASRRGMAPLVASLLIIAACTRSATPPPPTTPEDAFAPTPTIGLSTTTRPAPTTTLDLGGVVLQRVDPVSLEPVTAFEPIPMGDSLWEPKTSPNGRFLAAAVGHDTAENQLRLVDLQSWLLATSWVTFPDLIVHVDDAGSVYFVTYNVTPGQLHFSVLDGTGSTVIADLPEGMSVWGAEMIGEQIVLYGTRTLSGDGSEGGLVATIDVSSREVVEVDLPEVHFGPVEPMSQGPWASYLYNSPSFTVDRVGQRVLVAHANESSVTEVDLPTGQAIRHDLADATATPETGTRRWGAVSPEGRSLYVASRNVELIEDDDDWLVNTIPAGVATVDTSSWQVVARTDEPISDIWVSPSGALLGSGYTTEESESVNLSESTGLYLLDPSDLSVRVHYPPETPEQWWGPVTFTDSGSIAYASTWVQTPKVNAIEMATGEFLSTAESTETLEMIGPAGVLATNH